MLAALFSGTTWRWMQKECQGNRRFNCMGECERCSDGADGCKRYNNWSDGLKLEHVGIVGLVCWSWAKPFTLSMHFAFGTHGQV